MTKISIEKIQKVTSKGQITLPAIWRKQFDTGQVVVTVRDGKVEIVPVRISHNKESAGYTYLCDRSSYAERSQGFEYFKAEKQ